MDIGGINRIKSLFGATLKTDVQRNKNSSADRDADGRQSADQRKRIKQLSAEQEVQAIAKLNALPAFAKSGLRARLVKEEGKATHAEVYNSQGEIVRRLPYEQVIDLYLERNSEDDSGRLLKRAA